ncbi:MAG: alpha/beta fold hydrolase [Gammaproteobacteria bacterium]|nr:alpha/beta fold hydrolase [Gammaproteobacteria bacterium]
MSLALAHSKYGTSGPPLIVLHGLFGSQRNWNSVSKGLSASHVVYSVDLRNHGQSPWAPTMTYQDHADDLRKFIEDHALSPVTMLGHSMGGKCAMWLALHHPQLLQALIIADIAPVSYAHEHRSYVQAMREVDVSAITRRSDADTMLVHRIEDPRARRFLLQNLIFEDGRYRWRINLAAIEQSMELISGFPQAPVTTDFHGPTLFLKAGRSDYIKREHQDPIRRLFPRAQFKCITEAGHWLHADQPEQFIDAVETFVTGMEAKLV